MSSDPLLRTINSKGGLRTLPFIIANEAFEKVASFGIMPNLIIYLMKGYGFDLVTGSNILLIWNSINGLMPVIGAIVADSYVGRFWMIGFGSLLSLLGTILLWLTTIIPGAKPCDQMSSKCASLNISQLTLLVSSLGLMSVGAGGIRASSLAFGVDQLVKKDTNLETSGLLESFMNWYNIAATSAVILATTLVVYIQENYGWQLGFGIPVILMLSSGVSFFLASHIYVKTKPESGSTIGFGRVLVASWKKRQLDLSSTELYYNYSEESKLTMPSDQMRFLNRACAIVEIKDELAPDGTGNDRWNLCTIDQVEELKTLIMVLPVWFTGIMMSICTHGTSLSRMQLESMDRHITSNFEIPAGSFGTFSIIFLVLWMALYDRVIMPLASRIAGRPVQIHVKTRIGVGLLLSFLSMVMSAIVEGVRRKIAIQEGFVDNPEAKLHMSALWLLPHACVSGVALALVVVGQSELFYSQLPKSMSCVATNLYGLGMFVAGFVASLMLSFTDKVTSLGGNESWLASNINKAHLDYYYGVLAALSLINFFIYLHVSKSHTSSYAKDALLDDAEEI